jgi:hypothetical protein
MFAFPRSRRTSLLALSAVASLTLLLAARAGTARADEPKKDDAKASAGASVDVKIGGSAEAGGQAEAGGKVEAEDGDEEGEGEAAEEHEHAEHEGEGKEKGEHHEHHEEVVRLAVDLVLGWGKGTIVGLNPGVNAPTAQPTYSRMDNVSANVQSFIFGGSVEVAKHIEVGVRVPVTFATFNPDGGPSISPAGVGNVELEGEYGGPVAHGLRLSGALGFALPTATGNEIPDDFVNQNSNTFDKSAFNRFSMNKAAAYARGYEDNALFEPNRFGIIPKLGLLWRMKGLSVEPYLKVENLIGTSSNLEDSYVGELVGALRVGYWVHKQFEVAARVWFNTGFAGSDEDKQTSAAVEPQIVLRFGHIRPYAGFLAPLAGPPNQNGWLSARIGVQAGF